MINVLYAQHACNEQTGSIYLWSNIALYLLVAIIEGESDGLLCSIFHCHCWLDMQCATLAQAAPVQPLQAATQQQTKLDSHEAVPFRIRLRKQGVRGDDDSRRITVPANSAIAASLRAKQAVENEERQHMKKLVLAASESQAAEEHAADIAQIQEQLGAQRAQQRRRAHTQQRARSGMQTEASDFVEGVRNVRGML